MLWKQDGLLPSVIAENTTRDRTTTTRMLDRLVKKGFVVRGKDESDGRLVIVKLTERGRELKEILIPVARDLVAEATEDLKPAELENAVSVLRVITKNNTTMDI